jgi:hypothetical protein
VTNLMCYTRTDRLPAAQPFAISHLMAQAAKLGFEYQVGNKALTLIGPTHNAPALTEYATSLGLELIPGAPPGEVIRSLTAEVSTVHRLHKARVHYGQYQNAKRVLGSG